jgi:hypothetical protein
MNDTPRLLTSWALSLTAMDEFADDVKPTAHWARERDVVTYPVNRRFRAVRIQVFLHLHSFFKSEQEAS